MNKLKRFAALVLALLIVTATLPTFVTFAADSDMRYGRKLLGEMSNGSNMQAVYDQLVTECADATAEIKVNIGENNIDDDSLCEIFNLFYYDYPEYFWLNGAYSFSGTTESVNFKPIYTFTGDALTKAKSDYNAKVTKLTSGISGSDYEKAKTLHDRLIDTVQYEPTNNDQNAYGALVEGKAVCNGYARAYQHLMISVGIPAWYIRGTSVNPATNLYESHAWNLVKLDGKWYYTDVTWDDQGDNTFYAYFNVTKSNFDKDHNVDDKFKNYIKNIDATSTEANYYVKSNRVLNGYNRAELIAIIKADKYKTQLYINGDVNKFINDFSDDFQNLATELQVVKSVNIINIGNAVILDFETIGVWKANANGCWYQYPDGTYPTNKLEKIDGAFYYFNESGYAVKGWATIGDGWYYFNESDYKMAVGWLQIGSSKYYFNSNGKMVSGWFKIESTWYYFNPDGSMATNCWVGNYWVNESGTMATGWKNIDGSDYYFTEESGFTKGWKVIDGQKYLFDTNGKCIENVHKFVIDVSKNQDNIDWDKVVSAGVDAVILRSSYATDVDRKFNEYISQLNEKGIPYGTYTYNTATTVEEAETQAKKVVEILKNANANPTMPVFVDIEQDDGKCDLVAVAKTYMAVFVENGYLPGIYANKNYWTNYLNDESLDLYYKWIAQYGVNNGYPSTAVSPNANGENYMMWQYTDKGVLDGITDNTVDFNGLFDNYIKADGWRLVNSKYYYYQNGYLTIGWKEIGGSWYYFYSDGQMAASTWIGNDYVTASGAMGYSTWQQDSNGWWYSYADGSYAIGWAVIDGSWYYFNASGYMQTGWQLIGSDWYYFYSGGQMATNTWIGNDYVTASGAMGYSTWQQDSNGWWYSYADGSYAIGWAVIDGSWYYFNASGYMQTDWALIGGSWYYFYSGGQMASNCYVGGYWLTASGVMA